MKEHPMKIHTVMTKEVVTCGPDDSLRDAAQRMWQGDCGFVPIVLDGRLQGVITDRDICMASYFQDFPLSELRVRDVMIRDVETCGPDAEIEEVEDIMARAQVRRVPVVSDASELLGVVSLNDIALASGAAAAGDCEEAHALAATVAAISAHRRTTPGSSSEVGVV
jgi:CBS domain-containing protein